MGSFSWLKADDMTEVANIAYGKPFKFLIPKEFGGGCIEDCYQDYGYLGQKEDGSPKYDIYELLAFWNCDMVLCYDTTVKDCLQYDGGFPLMKEIDDYTDDNRDLGISIGIGKEEIDELRYPLKLVSMDYNGTYEDLDRPSYDDPCQGCNELMRGAEIGNEIHV